MKELRTRRKCHLLNQMTVCLEKEEIMAKTTKTTRNQQFYQPKPKTEEAKKSPYCRGAKLWLKLNIRQMEGKEEPKKATKNILDCKDLAWYTDYCHYL